MLLETEAEVNIWVAFFLYMAVWSSIMWNLLCEIVLVVCTEAGRGVEAQSVIVKSTGRGFDLHWKK